MARLQSQVRASAAPTHAAQDAYAGAAAGVGMLHLRSGKTCLHRSMNGQVSQQLPPPSRCMHPARRVRAPQADAVMPSYFAQPVTRSAALQGAGCSLPARQSQAPGSQALNIHP